MKLLLCLVDNLSNLNLISIDTLVLVCKIRFVTLKWNYLIDLPLTTFCSAAHMSVTCFLPELIQFKRLWFPFYVTCHFVIYNKSWKTECHVHGDHS